MEYYLWVKSLHIISVISWMAGMLYLPRLFVYHCETEIGSKQSETFKVMERKLLKIIMLPAIIITWLTGLFMAYSNYYFLISGDIWPYIKLFLIILMTIAHGYFSILVKSFAIDNNKNSSNFYRVINELPTLFMIIIVIMVVTKPF